MKKEINVERTVKETIKEFYCDSCGEKIEKHSVYSCIMCGKHMHRKCIGHIVNSLGDYDDYYCKSCWEVGDTYRKAISILEDKITDLEIEWRNKCENQK